MKTKALCLASVALAALALPVYGLTYDDVANGITFTFDVYDDGTGNGGTATLTDVSFYIDPYGSNDPSGSVPAPDQENSDPEPDLPNSVSVQIPSSVCDGISYYNVTAIAYYAFNSLAANMATGGGGICVHLPSTMKTIWDGAFEVSDANLQVYLGDADIPDGLEYFGCQGYNFNVSSSAMADQYGVLYIDDWVVGYDYNQGSGSPMQRRQVNLSAAAGIMGGAFVNATQLQAVVLPSNLKVIPPQTFYGCTALGTGPGARTITIPASVEGIGDYAFYGDSNVTNFVFAGDAPACGFEAFLGVGSAVLGTGETAIATVQPGTSGWGTVPGWWNGLQTEYATSAATFTITWLDDDGTLLATETWPAGSRPSREGPTKASTAQYTYTFDRWTPTISRVSSNATYTASYTATTRSYPVNWYNWDGSLLYQSNVPYGNTPVYNNPQSSGQPPTRAPTAEYTYTFSGWTPELVAVTGPGSSYTAVFTSSPRTYTITWLDDDGTTLATEQIAYGTTPSRVGPTKPDNAPYAYAFAGWTPTPAAVTGDTSYAATYTRTADLSTLTGDWTAADGDILVNSTAHSVTVPAGATVTINGVSVTGGAGSGATGPATFAADGKAITTGIEPGAGNVWTLTAFVELEGGSADGLDDAQVKVRRADTLAGLATAVPSSTGVTVVEKKNAVKVELDVAVPAGADSQFFRVDFED